MPENIKISRTGMIIVGAAVGEDELIVKHIQKVFDAALQKTTALQTLENPQAAMVLIASCLITSLCYHLQVTPPRLALSAVQCWDKGISRLRQEILSPCLSGCWDSLPSLAERT